MKSLSIGRLALESTKIGMRDKLIRAVLAAAIGLSVLPGATIATSSPAFALKPRLELAQLRWVKVARVTATPTSAVRGGTVNFLVNLQAILPVIDGTVTLSLRATNSSTLLDKRVFSSVNIRPFNTSAFPWAYTIPASASSGSYSLSVTVAAKNGRVLAQHSNLLSISITAPSGPYLGFVNLDGIAGGVSGVYGEDYIYPQTSDFNYFASKNLRVMRLPLLWERLQPALNGELDPVELSRIQAATAEAARVKMRVILALDGSSASRSRQIGSDAVPVSAYQDLLARVARAFAQDAGVYGYAILHRPAEFQAGKWPIVAQAAVDAIRGEDAQKLITVPGECKSNTATWKACNGNLSISDTSNNMAYEAETFPSSDNTENFLQSYDVQMPAASVGIDRMKPFTDWLRERGARGYISAFNIPNDDPRWQPIFNDMLQHMRDNCLLGTYYVAGVTTSNLRYSIQPINGADRPQTSFMQPFTGQSSCSTF